MTDIITNRNGKLATCDGPNAVEAFRLRALVVMLDFKARTGMDMDRRVPAIRTARRETGLKTRDIATLRAAVVAKMNEAIARCEVKYENS